MTDIPKLVPKASRHAPHAQSISFTRSELSSNGPELSKVQQLFLASKDKAMPMTTTPCALAEESIRNKTGRSNTYDHNGQRVSSMSVSFTPEQLSSIYSTQSTTESKVQELLRASKQKAFGIIEQKGKGHTAASPSMGHMPAVGSPSVREAHRTSSPPLPPRPSSLRASPSLLDSLREQVGDEKLVKKALKFQVNTVCKAKYEDCWHCAKVLSIDDGVYTVLMLDQQFSIVLQLEQLHSMKFLRRAQDMTTEGTTAEKGPLLESGGFQVNTVCVCRNAEWEGDAVFSSCYIFSITGPAPDSLFNVVLLDEQRILQVPLSFLMHHPLLTPEQRFDPGLVARSERKRARKEARREARKEKEETRKAALRVKLNICLDDAEEEVESKAVAPMIHRDVSKFRGSDAKQAGSNYEYYYGKSDGEEEVEGEEESEADEGEESDADDDNYGYWGPTEVPADLGDADEEEDEDEEAAGASLGAIRENADGGHGDEDEEFGDDVVPLKSFSKKKKDEDDDEDDDFADFKNERSSFKVDIVDSLSSPPPVTLSLHKSAQSQGRLSALSEVEPYLGSFTATDTDVVSSYSEKGAELLKYSPSNLRGILKQEWQKRWFYLFENTLHYYRNNDASPCGCIMLDSVTEVKAKTSKGDCDTFTLSIELSTPGQKGQKVRQFIIRCTDNDEMKKWVHAIKQNMELIPFKPPFWPHNVEFGLTQDKVKALSYQSPSYLEILDILSKAASKDSDAKKLTPKSAKIFGVDSSPGGGGGSHGNSNSFSSDADHNMFSEGERSASELLGLGSDTRLARVAAPEPTPPIGAASSFFSSSSSNFFSSSSSKEAPPLPRGGSTPRAWKYNKKAANAAADTVDGYKQSRSLPVSRLGEFVREGDILLFSSKSKISSVTQTTTSSIYDHVGFVFRVQHQPPSGGKPGVTDVLVAESVTDDGVRVTNFNVYSKYHSLFHSIKVRRLEGPPQQLVMVRQKLLRALQAVIGNPYSLFKPQKYFKKHIDQEKIENRTFFCSELVAYCFKQGGLLRPTMPSSQYTPGSFGSKKNLCLLGGIRLSEEFNIDLTT